MKTKRNGYIDVIKFIFALMVADFHFDTRFLYGGFLAVEGFFMISGFLMMKSLEKSDKTESTGVATAKFILHKYKALLPILFSSVVVAFIVYIFNYNLSPRDISHNFWLVIFDIFPLQVAGFQGYFVIGISWYLSAMFIALLILYPLMRRSKSTTVNIICPLIVFLGYGILSARYGDIIQAGKIYLEYSLLHTGIVRGLAGCSLGCIISEITNKVKTVKLTHLAKTVFTVIEIVFFAIMLVMMHYVAMTQFDFIIVSLMFVILTIGIAGLSYSSDLFSGKWTKCLGTASTLIALNHYCWYDFMKKFMPDLGFGIKVLISVGLITVNCVLVYFMSKLLSYGCSKLFKKERWVEN